MYKFIFEYKKNKWHFIVGNIFLESTIFKSFSQKCIFSPTLLSYYHKFEEWNLKINTFHDKKCKKNPLNLSASLI